MTETGIDKGSEGAWATWNLLKVWVDRDDDLLASALERCYPLYSDVIWNLIVVTGGPIEASSIASGKPYEEILADVWTFLAARQDDEASRVVRAAITAWSAGDESAEAFQAIGGFDDVDRDDLLMTFVALAEMLFKQLLRSMGEMGKLDEVLLGVSWSLGTDGEDPWPQSER